ncbi:MAG: sensor histidine kinase [Phycisphaerae bacterium]
MSANAGEVAPERLQKELVVRQRQAMLGSLVSIIAHEYNNLMTPVMARAQDAVARGDVAVMRKALAITAQQTERALQFTRQVLRLADGKESPLEACRVADLVEAAITSAVRPFEKDGIELALRIPGELRIRARPLLFEQVLLNLLLNARQAMKGRRGKLSISACPEGDMVEIAVSDSGVGISPEVLNNLINPFLAADAHAHPGDWSSVGLGLSACRTIVQQHGGTIRAQANDGPGCTFRLRWPAA